MNSIGERAIQRPQERRCGKCGSALAVDNTARLCGRCRRDFRDEMDKPPAGLGIEFFQTDEMRAAFNSHHVGKVLKAYRNHPRFLKVLGKALNQETLGRWLNLTQAQVSKVENGKPEQNLDVLIRYAVALHLPKELLWFDLPGEKRADAIAIAGSSSLPTNGKSTEADWESPATIAERARSFTAFTSGEPILDLIRLAVTDVVQRYEDEGPSRIASETLKIRKTVQGVLDGWIHPAKRDDVIRLAAQSSALLGYMAVNAGKFNTAKAYCTEGEILASAANDVDLTMWIRGTQSFCAYYEKDYQKAAEIAQSGIALDPNSLQAIRLRSNGEARAWGMLGMRQEAALAIEAGMRLLESAEVENEVLDSCISFSPYGYARFAANAATAWVPLGNLERVIQYVGEIDSAVEEADSNWSRVLTRLDIATAALLQDPPDLEQSASFGITALRASGNNPIQSIHQRAATLRDLAKRWANAPAIREFLDAYDTWEKSAHSWGKFSDREKDGGIGR